MYEKVEALLCQKGKEVCSVCCVETWSTVTFCLRPSMSRLIHHPQQTVVKPEARLMIDAEEERHHIKEQIFQSPIAVTDSSGLFLLPWK